MALIEAFCFITIDCDIDSRQFADIIGLPVSVQREKMSREKFVIF